MKKILFILILGFCTLNVISVNAQSADSTKKPMMSPKPGASKQVLEQAEKANRNYDSIHKLNSFSNNMNGEKAPAKMQTNTNSGTNPKK